MSRPGNVERARLATGLTMIQPLLESRNFTVATDQGGGHLPFATATFLRGNLEIGLIVREKDQLGCPNYSDGTGFVGHTDMIWALGHAGRELLVKGNGFSYRDRKRGDAFHALRSDLETIVLPALDASEEAFRASLTRALRHMREKRGW